MLFLQNLQQYKLQRILPQPGSHTEAVWKRESHDHTVCPAEAMIVVSEIGEQWSPQTAPAMQADMEMIIISGLDFSNTATTIGIRIPKVPRKYL